MEDQPNGYDKPDEIDLEISRLAKLSATDYERARKEAAKKLDMRAARR